MNTPGRNGGTLRSFEKGQSGNPAGRPTGSGTISQIMKELGNFSELALTLKVTDPQGQVRHQQLSYSVDGQNTVFAVLAIQTLYRALRGDINAFKVLLDRTEGRLPRPMRLKPGPQETVVDSRPVKTAPPTAGRINPSPGPNRLAVDTGVSQAGGTITVIK